jgi:cobalt-zinc-cadmium efflux system outer membrane protein
MPWEFASALESLPTDVTRNDVVQRATASNYDILHLQQEQNVERSRAALLRAERLPSVDIEAGADFNSPPDFNVGPRGQLTIGVPIFNRNQGELAQSAANLQALEAQLLAKKRSVTGDVEAAFFDLTSKQTQVNLYRDKVLPAARQVEALAEESYRAGRANLLEVLNAQREVQQTEHEYLQSLFDLQQAFAELEEVVGVNLD